MKCSPILDSLLLLQSSITTVASPTKASPMYQQQIFTHPLKPCPVDIILPYSPKCTCTFKHRAVL